MKQAVLALTVFFLLACLALAGDQRRSILTEFEFSPEVCQRITTQASSQPLHLQVLVLDLKKGVLFFHADYGLEMTGPQRPEPDCTYREILSLEKGEYLFEFLLYDEVANRFAVRAEEVKIDRTGAPQLKLNFRIDELNHTDFDHHRQTFLFNPKLVSELFFRHMLWMKIHYQSERPQELWDEVYTRISIRSTDINYSAASREDMDYRYPAPGSDPWERIYSRYPPGMYQPAQANHSARMSFAIAEKMLEIAVKADNVLYLTEQWDKTAYSSPKDEKKILKAIRKQAGGVRSACRYIYTDELLNTELDEKAFKAALGKLERSARHRALLDMVRQLQREVDDTFFGGPTVSLARMTAETPLTMAEKIEIAAKIIRDEIR
ncbi:MAG: hypothetical protein JXQ27_11150 [Acidobacteria bacterium]|nr:hypothetical protein [Acidobacteriota bacterium]